MISESLVNETHAERWWRTSWRHATALENLPNHSHVGARVAKVVSSKSETGIVLLVQRLAESFQGFVFVDVGFDRQGDMKRPDGLFVTQDEGRREVSTNVNGG